MVNGCSPATFRPVNSSIIGYAGIVPGGTRHSHRITNFAGTRRFHASGDEKNRRPAVIVHAIKANNRRRSAWPVVTGSRERCNRKIHGTNAACAYHASGASTALQHRPREAPRKRPPSAMALDRHSAAYLRGHFLSPAVQERPSAGGAWTG